MAATTTSSSMLTILLLCAAAFLAVDGRHVVDAGPGEIWAKYEPQGKNSSGDLVAEACVNASMHFSRHNHLSQELCESALRSDKRSAAAKHPRDLALIAVDHAQRGAAAAAGKVDSALQAWRKDNGTWWKMPPLETLEYCQVSYTVVERVAPVCRRMVQEFDRYQGFVMEFAIAGPYLDCVNRMKDAAGDCRNNVAMFAQYVAKDEVEAVEEAYRRVILAKAMMEQMLQVLDFDE